MAKERKIKELLIEEEPIEKKEEENLQSNSKQKEKIDDSKIDDFSTSKKSVKDKKTEKVTDSTIDKEKDKEEENEHQFYQREEIKKKSKKKKWIIITVIFVIFLSLGLGLGLGLTGREKDEMSYHGPNGSKGTKYIQDYIDSHRDKGLYDVDRLKDQADVWMFDQLHEQGIVSNEDYETTKQRAERDAQDTIDNEKEDYRDNYGDNWEEEWDDHLINELGYDNEKEYKNGLISDQLKTSSDEYFTGYKATNYVNDDNIDNYKYHSTITNSSDKYEVLNNGDDVDGSSTANSQLYFDAYVNLNNPISYYDILLPFTFKTDSYNGMQTSDFIFTSDSTVNTQTSESLEQLWLFSTDYYLSSTNENGASNVPISLDNNGYNQTFSEVVTTNQTSENLFLNNALLQFFIMDQTESDYTEPAVQVTLDKAGAAFYQANDGIAQALNKNEEAWPGYTDGSLDNTGANSINDVQIDDDIGTLSSAQLDAIGKEYQSIVETEGYNIFANSDRYPFVPIEINYKTDIYKQDGGVITSQTSDYDNGNGDLEDAYLVLANDGLHVIIPGIYLDDSLDWTYGQTMLVSDFDKNIGGDDKNPYLPSYNILDSYDSWFESASEDIYLNEALNDEEFRNEYIKDSNHDGSIEDETQMVVTDFYNDIYMASYLNYLNITSSIWDFYNLYLGLYINPGIDFVNGYLEILEQELVFFQKPMNGNKPGEFKLTPTEIIVTQGLMDGTGNEGN